MFRERSFAARIAETTVTATKSGCCCGGFGDTVLVFGVRCIS
jgi:hypothetical protein